MPVPPKQDFKPVLMLVLATVCWGVSFPLMKGLVLSQQHRAPELGVWFITAQTLAIRFGLAAVVLGVGCLARLRGLRWLDVKLGLGLGLFGGIGTLFQMAALEETLSSTSAFLTQFTVLLVPLWLTVVRRKLPSWILCGCCALVLIGMAVLCGVQFDQLRLRRGEWLTLLAATLFSGQILWLDRREFAAADKIRGTVVMFAAMSAALVPVVLLGQPGHWVWLTAYRDTGMLVMMGVLLGASTLIAFTLMNVWQPRIAPTHATLVYCCEPVFASLYALFLPAWLAGWGQFPFTNETLTGTLWIGGALITLANILVQYDRE